MTLPQISWQQIPWRQVCNRSGWWLLAVSFGIFIGVTHDKKLLSEVGPLLTGLGVLVVAFTTKRSTPKP